MSNMVGGIQLIVPDGEQEIAEDLLDRRPGIADSELDTAIAASEQTAHEVGPAEPIVETPADLIAQRAFRSMAFGLAFPPLQIYALAVLWQLLSEPTRLSPDQRSKPFWTLVLCLPIWLLALIGVVVVSVALDDPKAPHWHTETLDFSQDHAMGVDFPAPVKVENFRNDTDLGPALENSLRTAHDNCRYWATVNKLGQTPDAGLDDASIETLLKGKLARSKHTLVSSKWIEIRGHTGIEYRTAFVDARKQTWTGRGRIFRVGDRFLEVGLEGIGAEVADDSRAKRFFVSLRIP